MMPIMMTLMISLMMTFIMLMFSLIMNKKIKQNREKSSPFECGFDPISTSRKPFSIQFFLISLMFIVFDIETALLIPVISTMMNFNSYSIWTLLTFIIILFMGLLIEYWEQSMEWKLDIS